MRALLLRVYGDVARHRLLVISAGVTFYALLAIFPAVAALVALYGIFADPSTITEHLDTVSGLFPGGAIDVLRDQMNRVAAQGRGTLGLAFFIGLVASLWSANSATESMFDALNLVYGLGPGCSQRRPQGAAHARALPAVVASADSRGTRRLFAERWKAHWKPEGGDRRVRRGASRRRAHDFRAINAQPRRNRPQMQV